MRINGTNINSGLDNTATQHRVTLGATEFSMAGELSEGTGVLRAGEPGTREITIEIFVCRPQEAAKDRESLQLDCSRIVRRLLGPCSIEVDAARAATVADWEHVRHEEFRIIDYIYGSLESYEIEEFWQGRKNKLTLHVKGFVKSRYIEGGDMESALRVLLPITASVKEFEVENDSNYQLPVKIALSGIVIDASTVYSDKYGRNAIIIHGLAHDQATGEPAEIAIDGDSARAWVIDGTMEGGTLANFSDGWGPVCHALPSLAPGKNKISVSGVASGLITVNYKPILI